MPMNRYFPAKEQNLTPKVDKIDKKRVEGKVFPKCLICFKFCASPLHIFLSIPKILQSIIFILLKDKLRFSKLN